MGKIGFIQDNDEVAVEEIEETCDLNGELIEAMNILIDLIKYHCCTIKGITISVDNQGVRTSQIRY